MTYKYPVWMKSAFVLGILLFPALTIISCVSIFQDLQKNSTLLIIHLAITILFGYFSFAGIKLQKFINIQIRVEEDSIQIQTGKKIKKLAWQQIGKIKSQPIIQFYRVYDKEGKLLFIVDHMLPGFAELSSIIDEKTTAGS